MRAAGDVLGKRYRLQDRIASGGMGEVWRATDEVLGRTVAVKVLHPRMFADPGFGARFRAEARTMAALRHPGVVDVYDYGEANGDGPAPIAYLVMAYVDSDPLSDRITAAGRLGATETMGIIAQTARALVAAHTTGVVHRDVKPGNLLIRPDGHVVLVDFGVARGSDATSAALTGINEVVGTALYMAPEQVAKGKITPATDIYALGAVAFHCLAGEPPFPGDNALTVAMRHLDEDPPPLPDDVPAPVRELVTRAMAKEPADRYPSAAAMAEAAERAGGIKLGRRDRLAAPTTMLPRPAGPAGKTEVAGAAGAAAPVATGDDGDGDGPAGWADIRGWSPRRRLVGAVAAVLITAAAVAAVIALANPLDQGAREDDGPPTPAPGTSAPGQSVPAPAPQASSSNGVTVRPTIRGGNPVPGATGRPTAGPGGTVGPTNPPVIPPPTGGPVTPTAPPPVTPSPVETTDPPPTDPPTNPPAGGNEDEPAP